MLQEVGPEVMDEVDQQSLDMGPVLVLICHDHQPAIAQCGQLLHTVILLLEVQAHDLDNVVDLSIVHDLNTSNLQTMMTCRRWQGLVS